MPLYLQLESRYLDLEEIRETLSNLDCEVLSYEIVEHPRINFHHLDIETGTTSDLVTPCFLPRSCKPALSEMMEVKFALYKVQPIATRDLKYHGIVVNGDPNKSGAMMALGHMLVPQISTPY